MINLFVLPGLYLDVLKTEEILQFWAKYSRRAWHVNNVLTTSWTRVRIHVPRPFPLDKKKVRMVHEFEISISAIRSIAKGKRRFIKDTSHAHYAVLSECIWRTLPIPVYVFYVATIKAVPVRQG